MLGRVFNQSTNRSYYELPQTRSHRRCRLALRSFLLPERASHLGSGSGDARQVMGRHSFLKTRSVTRRSGFFVA